MAERVVGIGNCSGREVDKFARFGLKTRPASQVQAPLLPECAVNLECRVVDTRMVRRYDLFVLEGVAAWQDTAQREAPLLHHRGWGTFSVDGPRITLPSRMP
jgi:flavin reductase (DIM6/NTAB) family NADH-FMN oxidoreductase RutF